MAETKYGKYFINFDKEKWRWPNKMYPAQLWHAWMTL